MQAALSTERTMIRILQGCSENEDDIPWQGELSYGARSWGSIKCNKVKGGQVTKSQGAAGSHPWQTPRATCGPSRGQEDKTYAAVVNGSQDPCEMRLPPNEWDTDLFGISHIMMAIIPRTVCALIPADRASAAVNTRMPLTAGAPDPAPRLRERDMFSG